MARTNFTTPVGRFVQGDVSKPRTTDFEGKPLTIKSGPNIGKATQQFYIAIAIRKGSEQHWSQTEWGAKIWAVGHAAFPQQAQARTFAWKVKDGDSQEPNRRGKKPADQEGYPGHWVLSFASQFAPKCYNGNGTEAVDPLGIKPGYFIQVNGDVDGNGSAGNPGVFLNASMVALAGYGQEILQGPDPTTAGFGGTPLPPGASATPVAQFQPPAQPGAALPYTPPASGAASPPPPTPTYAPPPPTGAQPASPSNPPPPPVYAPNPAFTQVAPAAPAAPAAPVYAPPPPPVVAGPVMTAKAQGVTYDAYRAQGWSDEQLRQHGLMA